MISSDADQSSNMGARGSQVKPPNCFRPLEKLVLPSTLTLQSFILDDAKHAKLSHNSFEWKKCNVLGGRNILWPLLHISGGQGPNLRIYAPELISTNVSTQYRRWTDKKRTVKQKCHVSVAASYWCAIIMYQSIVVPIPSVCPIRCDKNVPKPIHVLSNFPTI